MSQDLARVVGRAYIEDLYERLDGMSMRPSYYGYYDHDEVYDGPSEWRRKAIEKDKNFRELEALANPVLIAVLKEMLAEKQKADMAEFCFGCLGQIIENLRDAEGVEYLLLSLDTARQGSRLVILKFLRKVVLLSPSEFAFERVHPFLDSVNVEIRCAAALVLGRIGHPLCITALLEYLQSAIKEPDIHAALEALEACGDGTLLPFTLDFAFSSHGKAYWPAITCISSWLRADATPFLVSILERQRYNKTIAVAELAKWGDERALPAIQKRLRVQVKNLQKSLQLLEPDQRLYPPDGLDNGLKYLKRFRSQSAFDELNRELLDLLPRMHTSWTRELEGVLEH